MGVHIGATGQIRLNDCSRRLWLDLPSGVASGDVVSSQVTLDNLVQFSHDNFCKRAGEVIDYKVSLTFCDLMYTD